MSLGDKLKTLRNKRGLSQQQVAYDLNITQQAYSRYELGRDPDIHILKALAEYYGVSADYLLEIDNHCIDTKDLMKCISKLEEVLKELKTVINKK